MKHDYNALFYEKSRSIEDGPSLKDLFVDMSSDSRKRLFIE
jgi:hypothetical protein